MIIAKEFKNDQDLEALQLTSLLGVLISLKEDIISIEQAKSYWLNDTMLDLLIDFEASDDLVLLTNDCIDLLDKELNLELLQAYIDRCKELISNLYTNYDDIDVDVIN